jgi:endo-1,4-beta-D-glucanase Y
MRTKLAIASAAVAVTAGGCSTPASPTAIASPSVTADTSGTEILQPAWLSYTRTFIHAGRVVDPRRGNDTTSEGQSYALLRAVWMNDRTTFDAVWAWTRDHLWDQSSQRFGWLWGSGAARLVSHDSATDADEDIALSLIFAAHRWKDASYSQWAQRALRSVWQNDVATVSGIPYVVAGNWAATGTGAGPVLNPSYFAPYAYRIFAGVDTAHPWMSLVDSSYHVLNACSHAPLRAGASVGLPPNWCVIDRSSGAVSSYADKPDGDDYGYDAFRVMWRVALDQQWYGSPAARAYLAGQQFLRQQWRKHAKLLAAYGHDGMGRAMYEDVGVSGGDAGAFLGTTEAGALLRTKFLSSFTQSGADAYWGQADNYYQQNWAWFGVALLTGRLTNLAAEH